MIDKILPNGTHVQAFPITQAQRLMYYVFSDYSKNRAVLNIGTGHYWQGDIDVEALKASVYEAIERCDTMRLRFAPDEKFGMVQYVVDQTEMKIEEVDFSGISYDESYRIMKEWTYEPIDMFFKPLNTVKIIHLENNYHGLYIKFHHLAFDGYSSQMFLNDVMAVYCHRVAGAPYPKPTRPYIEALKKELAYLDSDKRKADRQYFIEYFTWEKDHEALFCDYQLNNRLHQQRIENNNPNQRYASCLDDQHPFSKALYFEVSAEESQKILDTCKEKELSIGGVLMFGLRTALSLFNDNAEDVSVRYMVSRRGSLLEKRSGGDRMLFFTMRTIVPPEATFLEALHIVEARQSEIYAHSSFDTLESFQMRHMIENMGGLDQVYDSTAFSYQPYLETPAVNEEQRKSLIGVWYNNDVSVQPLYVTVRHRPADKGFEFCFEYRTDTEPEEDLKVFYRKMLDSMMMGIDNPDMTVGEMLEKLKL